MAKPTIVFATSNPGKLAEVQKFASSYGLKVVAFDELELNPEIVESGATFEDNARIKAQAVWELLDDPVGYIVIGDDSGIEIETLDGAPGVKSRRWGGEKEMTDQEIVDHCMKVMADVPTGERGAIIKTVLIAIDEDGQESLHIGVLRGVIAETVDSRPLIPGMPYSSLIILNDTNEYLRDLQNSDSYKSQAVKSHRHKAFEAAFKKIT